MATMRKLTRMLYRMLKTRGHEVGEEAADQAEDGICYWLRGRHLVDFGALVSIYFYQEPF